MNLGAPAGQPTRAKFQRLQGVGRGVLDLVPYTSRLSSSNRALQLVEIVGRF